MPPIRPSRTKRPTTDNTAIEAMDVKLDRLIGDPLRRDLRDPDFMDFVGRQFERIFPGSVRRDATGRQVDVEPAVTTLEPFRPEVTPSDLEIGAGVGPGRPNRMGDVVGVKKALARTGLLDFDVTKEPSDQAGPLLQASLKRFQRANGLKTDAVVEPDGPTVKALQAAVFEDGDAGGAKATDFGGTASRSEVKDTARTETQVAQAGSAQPPNTVWKQSPIAEAFRLLMSDQESDDDYTAINPKKSIPGQTTKKALGRYQMRSGILIDSGMKKPDGSWTGKYGVFSDQDFLDNPLAQEKAFADGMAAFRRQLRTNGSMIRIGIEMDGIIRKIKVTESGLLAAAHREGAKKVRQYLEHQEANGWKSDFSNVANPKDEPKFGAIEKRIRIFESTPFDK